MSERIQKRNEAITRRFIELVSEQGYKTARAAEIIKNEWAAGDKGGYRLSEKYIIALVYRNKRRVEKQA